MSDGFEGHTYTDEEVREAYEMFAELCRAIPARIKERGELYAIGWAMLFITNETADFVEAELNEEFINMVHEAQAKMGTDK